MTSQDVEALIELAWAHHHKRNGFDRKPYVLWKIRMMSDSIDWTEFALNGSIYRRYWDRKGWIYNSETLLAWVENGCCLPAPEPETAEQAKLRRLAGEE